MFVSIVISTELSYFDQIHHNVISKMIENQRLLGTSNDSKLQRRVLTTPKSRFCSIHSCASLNSSCRPMMYRVSKASTVVAPSWEFPGRGHERGTNETIRFVGPGHALANLPDKKKKKSCTPPGIMSGGEPIKKHNEPSRVKDKPKAAVAVKNKGTNAAIFEGNNVRDILIAVCDHGDRGRPRGVWNE